MVRQMRNLLTDHFIQSELSDEDLSEYGETDEESINWAFRIIPVTSDMAVAIRL